LRKTKNRTYKRYQKLYAKCKRNDRHQAFLNKRYSELNIDYIKRVPKMLIKQVAINIDARLFDIEQDLTKEFNKFVKIRLPYFYENKKRAISINIPIKDHKHSLKFKN